MMISSFQSHHISSKNKVQHLLARHLFFSFALSMSKTVYLSVHTSLIKTQEYFLSHYYKNQLFFRVTILLLDKQVHYLPSELSRHGSLFFLFYYQCHRLFLCSYFISQDTGKFVASVIWSHTMDDEAVLICFFVVFEWDAITFLHGIDTFEPLVGRVWVSADLVTEDSWLSWKGKKKVLVSMFLSFYFHKLCFIGLLAWPDHCIWRPIMVNILMPNRKHLTFCKEASI